MHIYPAQKRWLGRQLVQLAREHDRQVFMVTHDPIILQGVLDSEGRTRIFRIAFEEAGQRVIQVCDLQNLDEVGSKRNQDSFLQGLFYQRLIAVEGAADRAFYQVMVEELLEARTKDKDLGFVACGGIGQSKNVAYIAAQVGLVSAFIYDFDALLEVPTLVDIMTYRKRPSPHLDSLRARLKKMPAEELKEVEKEVRRKGPASRFAVENPDLFDNAIVELKEAGVHIVPYGTLESWAEEVEPKSRFPELAPDVIRANTALSTRLTEFLDSVLISIGC